MRKILVIPFVIQIILAVALTGWLALRNGQQAVNDVVYQLRDQITIQIKHHLEHYLEIPRFVNQNVVNAIKLGLIKVHDPRTTQLIFWQQMHLYEQVSYIQLGNEEKEFFGLERWDEGEFHVEISEQSTDYRMHTYTADHQGGPTSTRIRISADYDPRIRPWYRPSAETGQTAWGDIFNYFGHPRLAITLGTPIYDDRHQLLGVVGTDLVLLQINQFLQGLKISPHGQAFIMERSGLLVATSTSEQPFHTHETSGELSRLPATQASNTLTKLTAQHLAQQFVNLHAIKAQQQLNFKIQGERYFVEVLPFQDEFGLNWLIVLVIPEADFMARIEANTRLTILLGLIALIIVTIIGILTAHWIIQPVLTMNLAAKKLAQGQWEQPIVTQRSDEIGELANSFNLMAKQINTSLAALEAKNIDLKRLDQLKDEFLANTSHELRTPLNGIIGIADSLIAGATGPLFPEAKTNLALIVASGRRLAHLVNDILDFSKLRHQHLSLQTKPIGIWEITEIVFHLQRPLVNQKQLQLLNQVDSHLPPVLADENRLQQILHNLIGNAIKFTEQGQIAVSAQLFTSDHAFLAITVADTGIGIPADKLERIFESFEQAQGSTARCYGGTGLGLAITRQLIELHGGQIQVESTLGVGSKFTFTLPLATNQLAHPIEISQTTAIDETSLSSINHQPIMTEFSNDHSGLESSATDLTSKIRAKILVVDDEPINRQVLANYLFEQYAITQAINGPEALQLLEQGYQPDLILLDVMMPQMTGYEVTQIIRQQWQANELPIILLTAKTQIADIVAGLESGANDYLTKPIAKDELLARLQTHLKLQQLRAENLRMRTELEITQYLQKMLLPKEAELKQINELDIAGFMEPAEEVGGDYYDVLQHNGHIKIGIGDVTGHGLASGVLMLMVQMAVRTLLISNITDPQQFLTILNRAVYDNVQRMGANKNLTLSLLDYRAGILSISGQHEEVLVVRQGGQIERIDTLDLGFMVGIEADIANLIAKKELHLQSGEGIVLYTDGVTEARNQEKQFYGIDRLCQIVSNAWKLDAFAIQQAVINDLKQYMGQQKLADDITIVVIKQK